MAYSQLSLPPGVTLQPGRGGFDALRIQTAACSGEITLYGAHVTGWQPRGAAPVIWMSAASVFAVGRPIRGGVPVCCPWFGPHPSESNAPPHGLARLRAWDLDAVRRDDEAIVVVLSLRIVAQHEPLWLHDCLLSLRASFGRELTLELDVRNVGATTAPLGEALHSYFAVGDIRQVAVEGLAGAVYVDKARGGERCVQDGAPIRFAGETDRAYLDTEATTTIVDAALGRRILVEKAGSRTTVVWNPWLAKARAMPDFDADEWSSMLCVETANALDNALTLGPGAQHRMRARIRVE